MKLDGIQLAVVAQALSTDPRQAARAARSMGVSGLQFEGVSSAMDLTQLSAAAGGSSATWCRRRTRRSPLRGDAGTRGLSIGGDVDQAISRISKLMEAAAGLGSPLVCIDLGPLPTAPKVARRSRG